MIHIGLLTFVSALVAQFVTQGLGLFLRASEASSGFIGLIYLASVPYTLRFLWGPIVDRYPLGNTGKYGGWLILTQLAVCLAVMMLFVTQPDRAPLAILILVAAFMIAMGFQQTALGGLIAAGLPRNQHAQASSIQGASSAAAGFILGAVVLYLLADLGWAAVVAALLVVAVLGLAIARQLSLGADVARESAPAPSLIAYFSIFDLPEARRLFGVAVLVNCVIVVPYAAKSILLIDAGYSISQGALYGIVGGNIAGFAGALLARPLVERFGTMQVLFWIGVLNISAALLLGLLWQDGLESGATIALILFANAIVFASFAASRAAILGLCRPGRQATEVASFVGFETVIYLIIAGTGMSMIDSVGLPNIMLAGIAPALAGLFLARRQRPGQIV